MSGESRDVPSPPPSPARHGFDQDGDATRRTWLASERTVLAWLRTGLTATAVALGVGKLIPSLADGGATWPYVVIGAGYGVLGIVIVLYGMWRGREVDRAIREGRWSGPDDRAMWFIAALAVGFGLMSVIVIVADT